MHRFPPPLLLPLVVPLVVACEPSSTAFVSPSAWLAADPEVVALERQDGRLLGRLVVSNVGHVDVDVTLVAPDDPLLLIDPDSAALQPGDLLDADLGRVDDGTFAATEILVHADGRDGIVVPVEGP